MRYAPIADAAAEAGPATSEQRRQHTLQRSLAAHETLIWHWSTDDSHGWYDLTLEVEGDATFGQQLAGHVETGKDSMSDPLIGA